ncbi:ubiquitin-conjugating enzyme/RWD-like protein [Chytriomyces sp. MP71]|nr:ubiquitin-conjugating enzyme/RWD-like protein [Chytriomyces sp. MP71]
MSNSTVLRLQREYLDISRNPDTGISIAYDEANLTHMHALITGPPMSAYSLGIFDFLFVFPNDYPTNAPKVLAMTTGTPTKRTRFNPNIYASGKVCLSILGTWRGEAGEQWSAAHGVLSVLVSIQSLMSDKPYLNEPGFENTKDLVVMEDYSRKIMHETLRVSVCIRLEKYLGIDAVGVYMIMNAGFCTCRERSPFEDMCKRLALLYHDVYQDNIDKEVAKGIVDGTKFKRARFETTSNTMDGEFQYANLKMRLRRIYAAIKEETESWIRSSVTWIHDDTLASSNLRNQFEQIRASGEYASSLMLHLVDDNPFVWMVTVSGPPGSVYEDGMFPCRVLFHNQFPDVLPRAQFLVDVFHPNVTVDGVPFYSVKKPEDVRQHLTALIHLFKEKPDPQPATHVNLRAAAMFLKGDHGIKDYNRNCRRCAQRSIEG